MIVFGERVALWVAERCGFEHVTTEFAAIGVERDGQIISGGLFTGYDGWDISLTVASEPGRLTRGFMRALGHYAFVQATCRRVSFVTERPGVVTVLMRLGARIEGVKRDAFGPGRDGVMLGLLKEDWQAHAGTETAPGP